MLLMLLMLNNNVHSLTLINSFYYNTQLVLIYICTDDDFAIKSKIFADLYYILFVYLNIRLIIRCWSFMLYILKWSAGKGICFTLGRNV